MHGTARDRLLAAALDLFAEHGVSGTSLQMIADRLGVTKAAVYHKFQTKEEIVQAVIAPTLEALGQLADAAEAQRSRTARVEVALAGVVDLVVTHRATAAILQLDPTVGRLVTDQPASSGMARLQRIFTGPDPQPGARVAAAMLGGGLMLAGVDPALHGLDDDTLRRQLMDTGRRILGVRPPRRPVDRPLS